MKKVERRQNDIQIATKQAIKKNRAIELWRETRGHITNMCRAIPVTRRTFYSWLKKDREFATAIINAEEELNDDVRDALIQKIADGDMTAIIFYLRRRHPDFADQPTHLTQIKGEKIEVKIINYANSSAI